MNVFKFLKSISGKLVMGIPQLTAIAGVGVLAVYGAYEADNTVANKERALRSVSAISSSSAQEGLRRQKNGLLTSINIKDSLNQVATAEERAAIEAGSGSADNFGLDAVDNIKNVSFGSAAETSATDGLGMGANKAMEVGSSVRNAPAGSSSQVPAGAVAAAAMGAGSGEGAGPTLASASMARASGNAFNATSGPVASSSGSGSSAARSSSGVASGGRGAGGASEGYQFSGAMPSGSNAVSSLMNARRSSSFTAGGRDSSVSRSRRSFKEKNELKDISKRSADVASNRNRAANEGSRVWLAGYENSGGMQIDDLPNASESRSSADFENPTQQKLKGIGEYIPTVDEEAEKQDKARKRLMWMALALVAVTVVAIPLGYHLIAQGKKAGFLGISMMAYGWIVLGIAMAYAAVVFGFAADYQRHYKGWFMPLMGYGLSMGAIVALLYAGISAVKETGSAAANAKFMAKAMGAVKTVGMMGLTQGGSALVQKGMESDAKANADSNQQA